MSFPALPASFAGILHRPTSAEALLSRVLAEKQASGPEEDAEIRWGQAPDFSLLLAAAPNQPTTTVIWPDDTQIPPDEPPEDEPPPLQYEEEWRAEEDVRIENPDDSDQYVIVARIKSIIFRGPDGRRHQFNLHPPE